MSSAIKKKLLFIGVGFYNYDKYITDELSKSYTVSYINSKGFEQKHPIISYICTTIGLYILINYLHNRYIGSKLENINDAYFDIVFVIRGENLKSEHLAWIKNKSPKAKYILYLWDSFIGHKNLDEIVPYFDKKYSFDSQDCLKTDFTLRPLFYFDEVIKKNCRKENTITFIGVDHSIRYKYLKRMKELCKRYNIDYSFHLFIGKVNSLKLRYFPALSKYDTHDLDILSTKQIPYIEYTDLIAKSKVVIDIANTGQTGLTMRTIESLAMGAKLITTNKYIKEYKDIAPSSYLVIDDDTPNETIVAFVNHNSIVADFPSSYSYKNALREMIE